jgi:hypothetical protein
MDLNKVYFAKDLNGTILIITQIVKKIGKILDVDVTLAGHFDF